MKALIAAAMLVFVSGTALAQEPVAGRGGSCHLWGKNYPNGARVRVTYQDGEGRPYNVLWTCVNGRWR